MPLALGGAGDGGDVHLAARQPAAVREDAQAARCRSTRWSPCWRRSRRSACRAPRCSSPAIPTSAPTALLHSLKHYKVLHEQNVILTIETARHAARRSGASACSIEPIGETLLARDAALRLHGDAERAEGAGDRAQARLAVRHHVDVVLPVAPLAASPPRIRACRAGRTGCSSRWRAAPTTPPTISRSRPDGWSRSARR